MTASRNLADALEALQAERKCTEQKLARLDAAIAGLRELMGPESASTPRTSDYADLTIANAVEAYLRETGEPCETPKIWRAIERRGASSESKNPVNLVYTTLRRDPRFPTLRRQSRRPRI